MCQDVSHFWQVEQQIIIKIFGEITLRFKKNFAAMYLTNITIPKSMQTYVVFHTLEYFNKEKNFIFFTSTKYKLEQNKM